MAHYSSASLKDQYLPKRERNRYYLNKFYNVFYFKASQKNANSSIKKSISTLPRGSMLNPIELEDAFQNFIANLNNYIPDGIIEVNLQLLSELGILEVEQLQDDQNDEEFPHYFHVIETSDKVTLFNHQFAVWIVPKIIKSYLSEVLDTEAVISSIGKHN